MHSIVQIPDNGHLVVPVFGIDPPLLVCPSVTLPVLVLDRHLFALPQHFQRDPDTVTQWESNSLLQMRQEPPCCYNIRVFFLSICITVSPNDQPHIS